MARLARNNSKLAIGHALAGRYKYSLAISLTIYYNYKITTLEYTFIKDIFNQTNVLWESQTVCMYRRQQAFTK